MRGLAPDRGLYMPGRIERLPESFFREMPGLSFVQIACRVAEAFFGEDVDADALQRIVTDTLSFDAPVVRVEDRIWSLELFHGPTLAFKDVGGRFMARMLSYFLGRGGDRVTVLVATSGDTGSADSQRVSGRGGYRRSRTLPEREGQRDSGEAVHDAGS